MNNSDNIDDFNDLLNWVASNPEDAAYEIRGLRLQLDYVTTQVLKLSGKLSSESSSSSSLSPNFGYKVRAKQNNKLQQTL